MDSNQIVSIFSLLLLFHQSQARPLDSPSPLFSPSPAPGPSDTGCWLLPYNCHNGSLAACVHPSSTGSKQVMLSVKNEGETRLTVNVSISHANHMYKKNNTRIPPHRTKQVKITANVAGNASIKIEAGNLGCVIHLVSTASRGGILDYISLATRMSPVGGASLLILTGLIIGSGCVYKCGKRGEGTPYQQLEMARPASPNNAETTQGWEQGWDEDWRQMAHGSSVNGLSSSIGGGLICLPTADISVAIFAKAEGISALLLLRTDPYVTGQVSPVSLPSEVAKKRKINLEKVGFLYKVISFHGIEKRSMKMLVMVVVVPAIIQAKTLHNRITTDKQTSPKSSHC
ncbi:hypothetical protein V6N13_099960 [Hibiscus sabdariffa]